METAPASATLGESFGASPAAPAGGEWELKFEVPITQAASVASWMRLALVPHPHYPRSLICSVYFDTAGQSHLEEKRRGDFMKTTHRIRWYAALDGRPQAGPAWLETKQKRGGIRFKTRQALSLTGEEAARLPLTDPAWRRWARRFLPEGCASASGLLEPLLEVRYRRERFTHPLCAASFCLDTAIHCPRTHPGSGFRRASARLSEAVAEQKSASAEVLPMLRGLPRFGVRRSSFSKYERLAFCLADDAGFLS